MPRISILLFHTQWVRNLWAKAVIDHLLPLSVTLQSTVQIQIWLNWMSSISSPVFVHALLYQTVKSILDWRYHKELRAKM